MEPTLTELVIIAGKLPSMASRLRLPSGAESQAFDWRSFPEPGG